MAYYNFVDSVKYESVKNTNQFSFKFYDKDKLIMGKPMKEHLHFAMAW